MLQDLPQLILDLVCGHLSYEDLLVLRSTCKGLKKFVDEKEFTKLNLFVQRFSYHQRLFYTDEQIGYPYSYRSHRQAILNSNRFRERFANVQKLIICHKKAWQASYREGWRASEFDLTCLNCFWALNHLDIDKFDIIKGKLNLQELKIASFQGDHGDSKVRRLSFELNCPKLRALKTIFCRAVLTNETDQLDYLHYDNSLDKEADYLISISPNIQKLSTICMDWIEHLMVLFYYFEDGTLSLPLLSQIRLERCHGLERLDDLADYLQDLKRDSRTKHIKFTLFGRLIDSPNELKRIASLIRAHQSDNQTDFESTAFDLNNVNDRGLLFLNRNLDLAFFAEAFWMVSLCQDTEFNEEIIKNLKRVQFLMLNDQCKPSVSAFELLARNCKALLSLQLQNQTLTEQLLEMMSNHLISLQCVRIYECRYETLKPLAKFRNLECVSLDFDPPRDELAYIFENSRSLQTVDLICDVVGHEKRQPIKLLRTTEVPKVHQIIKGTYEQVFEFDTLPAMIDYLNYLYEQGLNEKRENYGLRTTRLTISDDLD